MIIFDLDGTLCDEETPIIPTVSTLRSFWIIGTYEVEIWTARSESIREKTEYWLMQHGALKCKVKMRPIGNTETDEDLKEYWLHDAKILEGKRIDFVFDCIPNAIKMWRRHGIFVFNCFQNYPEF